MIKQVVSEAAKIVLQVHLPKTKEMRINLQRVEQLCYIVEQEITQVESFCYLDNIINTKGGTEEDVKKRIQKAFSTLMKSCESWSLNEEINKDI